jgi:iron(III) transport system ATP-binding protein
MRLLSTLFLLTVITFGSLGAGPLAEICTRAEDLRVVDDGTAFAATVARVLYQGGRTFVEAVPPTASTITLSLSLQSSEVPQLGSRIRLALIDGWVIPNR